MEGNKEGSGAMKVKTIEEGNANLLKLADFLEKLPAERFDYKRYASGALNLEPSCGTVGCALGWATAIPEFGLSLVPGAFDTFGVTCDGKGGNPRDTMGVTFEAAMSVFHVDQVEFDLVFMPAEDTEYWEGDVDDYEADASPQYVAAKIRRFVKERTP